MTPLGEEEEAIEAANDASREHPMRVIVLSRGTDRDEKARLDGQIRVGGDAGASEVVVLRAYGEVGGDEEGGIWRGEQGLWASLVASMLA